jgi:Ca2+-binding EF-hand superfamily protein
MEERIKMVFNFTDSEIKRMLVVFKKLDRDRSGTISSAEFFELPYFKYNPFRDRFENFQFYSLGCD